MFSASKKRQVARYGTVQKMKISIKDFFSKCDQNRELHIFFLKKKNFIRKYSENL